MATTSLKSIRGMHDITPAGIAVWHRLEEITHHLFESYGYGEIRVPILERTEVFSRSMGEATDVVEKEMYTFDDRSGESVSLRPEGTAGVVRSALQQGLLYGAPVRLWYMGPMFRYERPQRGRLRQFHQIGAEIFGASGPDADAELLMLCRALWSRLDLGGVRLEINSLGRPDERHEFRSDLVAFLSSHDEVLDDDSRSRLDRNPFRILDSKNPAVQNLLEQAPLLSDYLGPESLQHFDDLRRILDRVDLEYAINPNLVRGLDYYSHAVFEWISDDLGAQGTICGGGRYDGLVEIQGGKPWPGVGFAMGMERIVDLMEQRRATAARAPHCYLVMMGEAAATEGFALADRLRRRLPGLQLTCNLNGGSFKAQFRRADKSGADVALVMGEDELRDGTIVVKPLREDVDQESLAVDALAPWLFQRFPTLDG